MVLSDKEKKVIFYSGIGCIILGVILLFTSFVYGSHKTGFRGAGLMLLLIGFILTSTKYVGYTMSKWLNVGFYVIGGALLVFGIAFYLMGGNVMDEDGGKDDAYNELITSGSTSPMQKIGFYMIIAGVVLIVLGVVKHYTSNTFSSSYTQKTTIGKSTGSIKNSIPGL